MWRAAHKLLKNDKPHVKDWRLAGIALRLGNTERPWTCGGTTLSCKVHNVHPNRTLKKLELPKYIRKEARAASMRSLKRMEDGIDELGWRDPEMRKQALRHQIELFST